MSEWLFKSSKKCILQEKIGCVALKKELDSKKISICIAVVVASIVVLLIGLLSKTHLEESSPHGVVVGKAGVTEITSGDQDEAKKIADDGVFTMITRSMGQDLNPIYASQEGAKMAVDLIFEPLARRDKDGVMQPILAESISYNDKRDVVTIKIRNDILFSDGTPLTLDDVVLSLLVAVQTGAVGTTYIAGIEAFIDGTTPLPSGLQMLSHDTISITFEAYDLQNEQVLEIPIQKMTAFTLGISSSNLATYVQEVLGNGIGTNAYQLVENNRTSAYLLGNEYYREPIESITEIQIHDINSVYLEQMIEAQAVDYIYFGSQDTLLQTFIDDLRYAVYGKETTTVIGLMVNDSIVTMKNYYIRQAIHYAIDRRALLPEVHWYRYKPISSLLSGNGYLETDKELESELKKAGELFETGLNYLNKESFYITLPIIAGNELYETVAVGVEKELGQIGIHVNIKPQTTDAYIDSLYLTKDYDLYLEEVTILGTKEDYKNYAYEYFEKIPENFDEIWVDIAKAVTVQEKTEAYEAANQMMQEYSLLIPIARGQDFIGIAASWSGYDISPYTNVPENLHQCVYG